MGTQPRARHPLPITLTNTPAVEGVRGHISPLFGPPVSGDSAAASGAWGAGLVSRMTAEINAVRLVECGALWR